MKRTIPLLAIFGLGMLLTGSAFGQVPAKKTLVVEAKFISKEKNGTETVIAMPKAAVEPSTTADFSVDDGSKGVKVTVTAGTMLPSAKHQVEIQMTEKGKDGKPSTVKFPKVTATTGKSASTNVTSNGTSYIVELMIRPE